MIMFLAGLVAAFAFITIVSLLVPQEWLDDEEED